MGKTVVKHEDVEKLYKSIKNKIDENISDCEPLSKEEFHEVVEEIFGVTLPIESEKEKENK
jgi:hypothetical protein